jgi:DNA invertase Pin-like site-specific DNA recombinase
MELEESTMNKRRAIALIRVSTNAQDVQRQRTIIKWLAETYGLEIVRVLELHGVSGTATLKNEQVQRVLFEITQPGIDGLAAAAVDRLARPQEGADYAILDGFKRHRKFLWTKHEKELKLWVPSVWADAMNSLTAAGLELAKIKERTMGGKDEVHMEGGHAHGDEMLPGGVSYDKRTKQWTCTEEKFAQVKRAYSLLFQDRYALSEVCRQAGWGRGMERTLRSPIWKSIRQYPATEERAAFEVRINLPQVLTDDEWALAQTLIQKRRSWSKETADPRFLGAGVLICECGRPYYHHCDTRRGQHDEYYCASRFNGGPGCGACRLRRIAVDAAIVRITEDYMMDAKFLAAVLRRVKETPQQDTRAEREQELGRLEARRRRWMDAYDEERITKPEFDEKMDKVNAAIRALEISMPVMPPPPVLDTRAVVAGLVRVLARFRTWPFAEQRAMLRRAVRSIQVVDGTIPEFTLSGAFLGKLAHTKLAQGSSAW